MNQERNKDNSTANTPLMEISRRIAEANSMEELADCLNKLNQIDNPKITKQEQ